MKVLIKVSATKIIYSALNLLVLIWLLRLQAHHNREGEVLALYALLTLSFPMGLIFYTIVGAGVHFLAPNLGGENNSYE